MNGEPQVNGTLPPDFAIPDGKEQDKAPNTTMAKFANIVVPFETAHNDPSHLDLQCLASSL